MSAIGGLAAAAEAAPAEWKRPSFPADSRLHQLAPYIGKLKPVIARQLLNEFTIPGDTILDCFSGSGTIPLEAHLGGRRVLAFDANPYAITLTRAKLEAPTSFIVASHKLSKRLSAALRRPRYVLTAIPKWVSSFFHPETLQNALRFADECIEQDDQFLLACLLSILHHQRPGFLSYPSSHLVPYLRDKMYPPDVFPEMYEERELEPRLRAKIARTYKNNPAISEGVSFIVSRTDVGNLKLETEIDAIVTSPPYMNVLDYVRDNRLRMWFLDRETSNYSPEPTDKVEKFDDIADAFATNALHWLKSKGHCILVIGETVYRKRTTSHPAERILRGYVENSPLSRYRK